MNVTLLSCTADGDNLAAAAAAVCYASDPNLSVLKKTIASGHESVIEHVSFTFKIEGVSRSLLAQLTRHRIASFSVESQRYVDMRNVQYVVPESIKKNPVCLKLWKNLMDEISDAYSAFVDAGIPKEDARSVLPNAACTSIVLTMNARELRHFFSLRCCNRAQWEIRRLADEMLKICRERCPVLFASAGPGCVSGHCPEARPCGHPRAQEPPFAAEKNPD